MANTDYLKNLEESGFIVLRREIPKDLPAAILERYKNIPPEYLTFLQQFTLITNREDTSWFNSIEDFNGESDTDFKWNDFELQSLEAFEDDEEETENVIDFWNNHIPILMSVLDYQYLAICLESDRYGEIVYGVEPEFEEATKVCDNFNQLMNMLKNKSDNEYLKYFY
jgi:hypothetical protein